MVWESFLVTGKGMAQIFILGALGYFLVRKNVLGDEGMSALSRLTIEVTLPLMIFCQLARDFSFSLYPEWWIFPLLSLAINALGLGVGWLFSRFISGQEHRWQFTSLVTFQNSGYLPLALVAAILPPEKLGVMFIYLFLFMLGFNMLMFSLGVYMLGTAKERKFELLTLFSPPVVAMIIGLLMVFFKLNNIPDFIFKPLKSVGDATLPLAMIVVGGSLAQIHFARISKKAVAFLSLAKLIILPALGMVILLRFRLPELLGLLILIQLAVPSATSLSIIIRGYKKEDLLISQGIFFSHIFSLITLPVFLSLYFMLVMVR